MNITTPIVAQTVTCRSVGTVAYPVYDIKSEGAYIAGIILNTSNNKIEQRAALLCPLIHILQCYGVNEFMYIDSHYTVGLEPHKFGEVLDLFVKHIDGVESITPEDSESLPILFHAAKGDVERLKNALAFSGFQADPSLDNIDSGLIAFTRDV